MKNFRARSFSIFVVLWLVFILSGCRSAPCTTTDSIAASLEVKHGNLTYVGLNTATDSLAFGKVSPGALVERSLQASYSLPTAVEISMSGPLAEWTNITPTSFSLLPEQIQPVIFQVQVPLSAADGSYNGTVTFCFNTN